MSRNQRWLAYLVAFWLASACPGKAYNFADKPVYTSEPVRIAAISAELQSNLVLLQLDKRHRLPFPTMRLQPAPTGQVLTIDFQGALMSCPQANLRFPSSAVGQVEIMQWQAFPPVLRMIFRSADRHALQLLALESTRGKLLIRLPASRSTQARAYAQATKALPATILSDRPPTAPSIIARQDAPALRGPIITPQPEDATYRVLAETPQTGKPVGRQSRQPSAQDMEPPKQNTDTFDATKRGGVRQALKRLFGMHRNDALPGDKAAPASTDGGGAPQPPRQASVSLSAAGDRGLQLELVGTAAASTFRLHDPERYVIDMQAVDKGLLQAPSIPSGQACIKDVRIGSKEGSPNIARLVVDLALPTIQVNETRDAANHSLVLSFALPKQDDADSSSKLLPAGSVILLDAGHGGSDPGAERGDIQEKNITLAIVERLKHLLEAENVHVKLTRDNDTFVSLEERVKLTNSLKPDLFLSVHINSLETNTQTTGIETYYQTDLSRNLAQSIHERLVKDLAAPDRNIRKARFFVINHTCYPAVLAEVGFISNKEERDKLASSDYQLQVARALAEGITAYLCQRPKANACRKSGGTIFFSKASAASAACLRPQTVAQTFTQNLQTRRPWLPAGEARKP